MKKILWISMNAPYDSVAHGGGKTHNYYLKGLKKTQDDIRLLSFALEHERAKSDLEDYHIEHEIKYYPDDFSRILKMIDIYFYSMKAIKRYKKEGYEPDVIILQWTQMAFLIRYIKHFYPNAKYVVIEEDVTFLSYKRFVAYHKNIIKKAIYQVIYGVVKVLELDSIKQSHKTICSNRKDANLLLDAGMSPDIVTNWAPYYQEVAGTEYAGNTKDIVFYGAMGRPENHLSAVWFIENVMPLIKHLGVRFVIVGGGAKEEIKKLENDQIKVLGFVEDLKPIFSTALCMSAPLVLGAGIKIKVIEGLSAGLPVVTNEIGIEGIDAVDGRDYIFATTPEEHAKAIEKLLTDEAYRMTISKNAKAFIENEFNLESNLKMFQDLIEQM